MRCRCVRRSAAVRCSTRLIPVTPATSASVPIRELLARIKSADLVIVVGGRLGELPSQGYTLFDIPRPQTTFVHVHPGAEELGRVYSPHLAIHATPTAFAAALERLELAHAPAGDAKAAHADYIEWTEKPTAQPGGVNFGAVMVWLRENLPPDAILCNGAGNYAAWIHRFFRFRRFGAHVAPASGSMGYGVPAAVAMKRLYPERTVVCLAGDGDFLMNGQEFATAVQYDLPLTVIIVDNGMYGTIRMHQEREYPGRVVGDRFAQSGFSRLCARLRRLRRLGRANGGFPGRIQGGAGFRQARDRAFGRRSRSHHADRHARQNPRQIARGKGRLKGLPGRDVTVLPIGA